MKYYQVKKKKQKIQTTQTTSDGISKQISE